VPLEIYPAAQKEVSLASPTSSAAAGRARRATDDEILGLVTGPAASKPENSRPDLELAGGLESSARENDARGKGNLTQEFSEQGVPENLRRTLEENPELRTASQDAQEYRKTFETPEAARQATALLADLDRMDALFFSRKPEDHAELARTVAALDPVAFGSLAKAIAELANNSQ
jgi:hypothetical protein